jgi:hypothetical protein
MGIFRDITKSLKKAAPIIGGTIGFAIGGPMGASIGSGIGSLASGRSIEESLMNAAMGYGAGYMAQGAGFGTGTGTGAERLLPSYKGNAAFGLGTANPVNEFAGLGANSQPITAVKGTSGSGGITSMFDKLIPESTMGKLALGSGALALLAGGGEEKQVPFKERGYTGGQYRGGTLTTMDDAGNPISFDGGDEDQRRAYYDQLRKNQAKKKEVVTNYDDFGIFMAGGGEVAGPGTGTSDSVPARLSDGEFVVTADAVRGAGNGDRNVGAARMYDMMSQLERAA